MRQLLHLSLNSFLIGRSEFRRLLKDWLCFYEACSFIFVYTCCAVFFDNIYFSTENVIMWKFLVISYFVQCLK